MRKFPIRLTAEISEQDLHDVFVNAIEGSYGGVYYWAVNYKHMAHQDENEEFGIHYTKLELDTNGDDMLVEPKNNPVTIEHLADAIQKIVDGTIEAPGVRAAILANIAELGMLDAGESEAIVQVAAFGEIVYG